MNDALAAVLLTGPSSSGKTSVAQALRTLLPDVWLHAPIDAFFDMVDMSHPMLRPKPMTALASLGFFSGIVAAWRGLIESGNRLLIDVVANDPLLRECARAFSEHRVMIVELTAALDVLEARERLRADRSSGQARAQFGYIADRLVDAHDVRIDTSGSSVDETARAVARAMASPPTVLTLARWAEA
jgi:chloramphenicol 3-O-phosphotransferase